MLQLFLLDPISICSEIEANDESIKLRTSLMDQLESLIWSILSSGGGRSEARLWLCKAVSGFTCIGSRHQRDVFVELLRSKPLKRGLAEQILQLLFEKRPRKAAAIVAKRSYRLEDFFKGNPRRIMQWFSSFSVSGESGHRKGAKALSQYAFLNRDTCWEELEWNGKHGQSPAMVATKPHYFLDLDVQRTVENFIEYVPEFWSSDEFAESIKDGEILFIDTKFFIDLFVDLMYKEDSKEVWELIREFLMEEPFDSLCSHLIIVLEERDLCIFLELIHKFIDRRAETRDFNNLSNWLEIVLSKWTDFESIDHLLLLNAIINQGRQLLWLVRDEEAEEERERIKEVTLRISETLSNSHCLFPYTKACFDTNTMKVIKELALLSWVIHYRLMEECHTIESWESLFTNNGISFRKHHKNGSLHDDGFSEESGSDFDGRSSIRSKRKKREKRRKKRRRKFDCDESFDSELLDFDGRSSKLGLESGAGSWFLSTDDYSTAWSSVDLPEHLSKHCLFTWLKLVFRQME